MSLLRSEVTDNDIKEGLSHAYVESIASRAAMLLESSARKDYGTDIVARVVRKLRVSGKTMLVTAPEHLNLQLKCTTEKGIREKDGLVHYSLKAKNYNHLVHWWQSRPAAPFFLVLLVLPSKQSDWISVGRNELRLRRRAYWWRPDSKDISTAKASAVIRIPKNQLVTQSFFADRLGEFFL